MVEKTILVWFKIGESKMKIVDFFCDFLMSNFKNISDFSSLI